MEQFKSFITEEKDSDYRILVLSVEHGDKSITSKRIKEEANKLNLPNYVAQIDGSYIKYDNGKHTIYSIDDVDDDKGFELDSSTVVFIRGTPTKDSSLDLISEIERLGLCCVNSRTSISIAADKYRSYIRLKDYGLTQPKTVLVPNVDSIEKSFESLDTKFPIILKTLRGSKGVGVLFVESERALTSIIQLIFKTDSNADLIIQEYIKTEFDVRVMILNGNIVATMQRDVLEGDFRSNYSQGAKVKKYNLTKLEIGQSLLAAKSVGGILSAVDFIPSSDPKNKPPYILEVNSSPGTEGIEEASGKNIVKEILEHFKNSKMRHTVPTQCGWEEVVSIKPFGDLIAKFDTGNSVFPVLHAEDIKIKGKKITFTHEEKTITTNLVGKYVSVTGGGEDERPVVELEFKFAGTNYGKIKIGLDDRSRMNTSVLMNRKLMNKLNVMINPQQKYVITTPFTLDK
jgi:ribosomal protein S6--L-glutamate ligase